MKVEGKNKIRQNECRSNIEIEVCENGLERYKSDKEKGRRERCRDVRDRVHRKRVGARECGIEGGGGGKRLEKLVGWRWIARRVREIKRQITGDRWRKRKTDIDGTE